MHKLNHKIIRLLVILLLLLTSVTVYSVSDEGIWNPTGSLSTARSTHTTMLLADGRVLVTGGRSGSEFIASAEIYNPVTGVWSTTGSLNVTRGHHTATLLDDGRVLVVGGGNGTYLNSAEIYDPNTGIWHITGSLNTARNSHTATLLPDGRVLVAGGVRFMPIASAEIYDPATGVWSITGSLNTVHSNHTATLLTDGRVLVAAGASYSSSAEIYDPATGIWGITGSLNDGRFLHTATLLTDGRVLIAGGGDDPYFASTEIYDPNTESWSMTGSLNTARRDHGATLLSNGHVLVVGGYNGGFIDGAEIYDPDTGVWTMTGSLNTARASNNRFQIPLLTNSQVLIAGGQNDDGDLLSAELFAIRPSVLEVMADSFLRSGNANTNEGANLNMVVRSSGHNRAIVSFDLNELLSLGVTSVETATLRLYIVHNANNWGNEGRTIDAHHLLEDWIEGDGANMKPANLTNAAFNPFKNRGDGVGITWKCAIDTEVNNQKADCDPKWHGGTYDPIPSDTVTIFKDFAGNNQLPPTTKTEGWVEFDVTLNVNECLADEEQSCSWLIRKTQEGQNGRIEFATKEGSTALYDAQYGQSVAPQLTLSYTP